MKKQEAIAKIIVIFPTKNEEDTIEHVIRTAKKSQHHSEVIVTDAFSSDKTVRIARDNGAKVRKKGHYGLVVSTFY
jgi:glycosyltransferase involved in cell wall biosynthesis